MPKTDSDRVDDVSSKVYDWILSSSSLRSRLNPEGASKTPYETVEYRSTLTLTDPRGQDALFHRTEHIRFLQDGVAAILDHYWGDGIPLTYYHHTAGEVAEGFREHGRRHLVIDLARPMGRGEALTFNVERAAMVGFTGEEEWLETSIDRPVGNYSQRIIFPRERACLRGELVVSDCVVPLRPISTAQGTTILSFEIPRTESHTVNSRGKWTRRCRVVCTTQSRLGVDHEANPEPAMTR